MTAGGVRPSFLGLFRGEALKVSRQLSVYLILVGAAVLLGVIVLATTGADNIKTSAAHQPTVFAYNMLEVFGTVFQIGSGIFLLLIGARLIAMEYSSGTVRIIYSRGVGRLQLLLAKLAALALIGILLLAGYLIVIGVVLALLISSWTGGLAPVWQISHGFWQDFGRWLLVQGMSMGTAILMAAAAAAVGRSMAFALAAALAFFPADNFTTIILALTARATGHPHPWNDISQYLLGPNLNVVLSLLEPGHQSRAAFATPLIPVDQTHALTVIGIFALGFALVAVIRTARPDVLE